MRFFPPAEQHGTGGQHGHGDEPERGLQAAASVAQAERAVP